MRIVRTETAYQGYLSVRRAVIEADDGETFAREIEDHGQAAAVLPYDPDRRVALVIRQMRAPALWKDGLAELLEAPAGMVDGDEDPADCVRREAMEEAGLALGELDFVAAPYAMPGVSTERIHLFLAPYAAGDRMGAGGGVAGEHERIVIEEIALADLRALAERGEIADMKTLALVQALRLRRPELF